MKPRTSIAILLGAMLAFTAHAGPEDFAAGPIINGYGKFAPLEDDRITSQSQFKVAFDIATAAEPGQVNRGIDSAARFLNMHAAAGVPLENIKLAIVVHGPAASDLLATRDDGSENPNAPLIMALIDAGVTIELCGQTAAMKDIETDSLVPGVTVSLSAMTAHALLQQGGYTINPF